jgi:citrate synthase
VRGRGAGWDGYWTTKVGWASEGKILVRGYRAEELIRRLAFAEAAYLVIRGELPTPAQARALDAVLRSGLDQAFINSAVPPARFAASAAPEAPAAAIAAGVIAFGSVTGSPRQCAEMLIAAERMRTGKRSGAAAAARRLVAQYRRENRKIPGLGHPLHKREEPRAQALREVAMGLGAWGDRGRLLDAIAREAARQLGRPVPVNLAGAVGAVLLEIGFEPLEMVGLAILGYIPALIAHTVEELREGVPLRIIPEALGARYAGPPERELPAGYGSAERPAATRRPPRTPPT